MGTACSTPGGGVAHSYKLAYFDARGVIEVARFMFAVSKTQYEDHRFKISFGVPGDFSTIKREEFDKAKAAGDMDVSLGKVPYLEVDGVVKLAQSKAIERFLARELGFAGADSVEAAQIDALCEHVVDFKNEYQKAKTAATEKTKDIADKAEKDKAMQSAMEPFFKETLPERMRLAEKSLPKASGPWLVGSSISWADLAWFQFLAAPKGYFDNAEGAKAAFQACPRIKAALEAVAENAELKEWLAKRPDTMF